MLPNANYCDTHSEYALKLKITSINYMPVRGYSKKIESAIDLFSNLDLTKITTLIGFKYSYTGRTAKDPVCMFRTLLFKAYMNINNFEDLADTLKDPVCARICGFDPSIGKIDLTPEQRVRCAPGATTFYDFSRRLWDGKNNNLSESNVRTPKKRPPKPAYKGEKAASVENETCEEAIIRLKETMFELTEEGFGTIFSIYKEMFLRESISRNVIDPTNITASGDGTPIETSVRERSYRACPKNADNKFKCLCDNKKDCPYKSETGVCPCEEEEHKKERFHIQPDTDWGYDSSRNRYFHGYDLYLLVDTKSGLPLFPMLNCGSKHDLYGMLETFFRFRAYLPELKINNLTLDAAHDATPVYELFYQLSINAFIDLNKHGTGELNLDDGFSLNADGFPVCKVGKVMKMGRVDKKRGCVIFHCPLMSKDENGNFVCTCSNPCSSAKRGKTLSIPLNEIKVPIGPSKESRGPHLPDGFKLNQDNIPICPEQLNMILKGHDVKRGYDKYGCPCMSWMAGEPICKCNNPCSNARFGRTLTVRSTNIDNELESKKNAQGEEEKNIFVLDQRGLPICPMNLEMKPNGTDSKKGYIKFRCPLMKKDNDGNMICTCPNPCSSSKYGKDYCVNLTDNLRLLNSPPRGSDEWKKTYNSRTSSERCNKRIKIDFQIEKTGHRSTFLWYLHVYLIMMLLHVSAWS